MTHLVLSFAIPHSKSAHVDITG